MRRCVSRFHDGDEFGRRRLGERYGFNLSECIGTSLLLPKVDPVISDDTFAYEESEIRFCGQKIRFDSGEVSCDFGVGVNGFITLDTL